MRSSPPLGDAGPPAEVSLWQAIGLLIDNLPGIVSDRVHLLALELRRAGLALGQMLALLVFAAIGALTAWFALWVGIVAGLIALDLEWGWAVLIVFVANAGLAWFAVNRATSMAPLLKLPATIRSLTFSDLNPLDGRSDER